MPYRGSDFERLTEYTEEPLVFFDTQEWHDMRSAAGLVPQETFGQLGKDGQWQEHMRTTSGRMLGWLYRTMRSLAMRLFRWLRSELSKSR